MCFLLPSSRQRELCIPWIIRVHRALASRSYWQAAQLTHFRLRTWAYYSCLIHGIKAAGNATTDVLDALVRAGVVDRVTMIRVRLADLYLCRVIQRELTIEHDSHRLRSIVSLVADKCSLDDSLFHKLHALPEWYSWLFNDSNQIVV